MQACIKRHTTHPISLHECAWAATLGTSVGPAKDTITQLRRFIRNQGLTTLFSQCQEGSELQFPAFTFRPGPTRVSLLQCRGNCHLHHLAYFSQNLASHFRSSECGKAVLTYHRMSSFAGVARGGMRSSRAGWGPRTAGWEPWPAGCSHGHPTRPACCRRAAHGGAAGGSPPARRGLAALLALLPAPGPH